MAVYSKPEMAKRATPLGTVPEDLRHVEAGEALQRVLFVNGRSLSAAALELEARNRDIRLGMLGRALSPGVVSGLEVQLAEQSSQAGRFTLQSGYAIGPTGQDITISQARTLDVADLPRLRPNLQTASTLVGVGVLALQAGSAQEADPGSTPGQVSGFAWDQQRDPDAAPYAQLSFVDGAKLVLIKLTGTTQLVTAPNGLNAASQMLIDAEQGGTALANFTKTHVPLALVGIRSTGEIRWISRYGAARSGGGVLQKMPLVESMPARDARLQQSSVESFLEQLRHWQVTGVTPDFAGLQHLPSAGLVPANGRDIPQVFPPSYASSIAPVPLSQAEAILQHSAALAPFDLSRAQDEVVWHLPVPDAVYDPELLIVPSVDVRFETAVDTMETRVANARLKRDRLRIQSTVVEQRIDRAIATDFGDDAGEVTGEDALTPSIPVPSLDFSTQARALYDTWFNEIPRSHVTAAQLEMIDFANSETDEAQGAVPFQKALTLAMKAADDFVDFGFTRVQADIYRLRQTLLDNEESTKLATFPILAGIAKGTNAIATSRNLKDYFNAVQTPEIQTIASSITSVAIQPSSAMNIALVAPPTEAEFSLALGGFNAMTSGMSLDASLAVGSGGALSSSVSPAAAGVVELVETGPVFKLEDDTAVGVKYSSEEGYSLQLEEAKGKDVLVNKETYLAETYQDENIYGKLFEENRKITAEDYALQSLAEKQAGIKYASAIPGQYQDLRTVTIADRLTSAASMSARISALRVKADAFSSINTLEMSLEGVRAPITALNAPSTVVLAAQAKSVANALTASQRAILSRHITSDLSNSPVLANLPDDSLLAIDFDSISAEFPTEGQGLLEEIRVKLVQNFAPVAWALLPALCLKERLDPAPSGETDESDYLTAAVAILESTVSIYRATEKRIAEIAGLVEKTKKLISDLQEIRLKWLAELGLADRDLAEARYDLVAARALKVDEENRVADLAQHREAVLAKHVKFAIFARPRRLMPHGAGITSSRMLAGVYEDPLPQILARRVKLPAEVDTLLDLLWDMPVSWFKDYETFTQDLKTTKKVTQILHVSTHAAAVSLNVKSTQSLVAQLGNSQPMVAARSVKTAHVSTQIMSYYQKLHQGMQQVKTKFDLAKIGKDSLAVTRKEATKTVTLKDVVLAARNEKGAQAAQDFMRDFERVLGGLLDRLSQASSLQRLVWVDQMSVFDGDPVWLRPTDLPGWFTMNLELRRDIIRLHGWLMGQMRPKVPQSKAFIADILQVLVLHAGHGATDQIVSARIDAETTVQANDELTVSVVNTPPALGTQATFELPNKGSVWGTVEDIKDMSVKIRINPNQIERVTLQASTKLFFDTKSVLNGKAYGRAN